MLQRFRVRVRVKVGVRVNVGLGLGIGRQCLHCICSSAAETTCFRNSLLSPMQTRLFAQ